MPHPSSIMMIRLQTIDRCLQDRRQKWTRRRLAKACNDALYEAFGLEAEYSASTIHRDLKFLKREQPAGYGAPLEWMPREGSYRYTKPGYSIHQVPLQQQDINAIEEALSLLRSVRYFQQQEGLETLAQKLSDSLHLKRQQLQEPALLFSHAQPTPGQQWVSLLYEAALHQHCLQLQYQPFEEALQSPVVSPYLLREYNRRWFLIGYSHREEKIRTYALDRIRAAEQYLLQAYYRDPAFQPQAYFRHIIGVSLPESKGVETIRLRAEQLRARYIETKPIHPSQQIIEETKQHTVFELQLIPNIEFERLLLSFGEEATVLQPRWLAERVGQRLRRAADNYPPKPKAGKSGA